MVYKYTPAQAKRYKETGQRPKTSELKRPGYKAPRISTPTISKKKKSIKYTPRRTYTPKTPAGKKRPEKRPTIKEKRAAGGTALQPKPEVIKVKHTPVKPIYPGRGVTPPLSTIQIPDDVQAKRKIPTVTPRDERYVRTVPTTPSVPWHIKLPQDTTRSKMRDVIGRGYPGTNTSNLTDYQLKVLYENVRAGITQPKKQTPLPVELDIKLTKEVVDFETWVKDKAQNVRDLKIPFGEGGPVKYPRESIARTAELIGGVPASIEKVVKSPESIPGFATTGLHAMTIGLAKQFKDDPIQTTSDIALTMGLFRGVGKVRGKVTTSITSARRGKIEPSAIIEDIVLTGERKFPVTGKPGVTTDAAISEFIRSEKNIRTAIETGKVEPPITAKLTGSSKKFLDDVAKTEGEMSAWHATQTGFPKTTTAQIGTSSTPGLHVAPSLSPHFLGVGGETAVFGFRKSGKPSAISIQVESFQRIPHTSRKTSESMNTFLNEQVKTAGPQGIAFITTKFEQLAKKSSVEFEAVLPPGTPIIRVSKSLEMTWKGKKITVEQYKTVYSNSIKTDLKNITTLEKLYSERMGKKVLVSPYDVLKAGVSGSSRVAKSDLKYTGTFSSSVSLSISSIKSDISTVTPPDVSYPSSIVSVKPSTSFTSYSSAYSSRAASYIRAIESYISSAPGLIRPAPVIVSARTVKRRAPTEKKKSKTKMEIKDWFIENPIPTLKSLYGI